MASSGLVFAPLHPPKRAGGLLLAACRDVQRWYGESRLSGDARACGKLFMSPEVQQLLRESQRLKEEALRFIRESRLLNHPLRQVERPRDESQMTAEDARGVVASE